MPLESHGLRSPNDDASEVLADGDLAGVAATAYVGLEQGRAGGVSRCGIRWVRTRWRTPAFSASPPMATVSAW
jgi:hypothetical protein